MKRILALIASIFIAGTVHADCASSLGINFAPNQTVALCSVFGSAIQGSLIPGADNTYDVGSSTLGWRTGYFDTSVITPLIVSPGTADLTVRVDDDAQRIHRIGASSDTALTYVFGDAGVTAAQVFTLSSTTADTDDDSQAIFTAGGAFAADGTRGAYVSTKGNEASGAGDLVLGSGSAAGSDLTLFAWATDGRLILGANGANRWMIESDGDLAQQAAGGNILLATTGTTLAVDSGTAASACKGQVTANGATPVVTNTTCATTGASVFLTKASASTAVNGSCTVTAISNGVSFTIECLATDTGAYNFWILKEG